MTRLWPFMICLMLLETGCNMNHRYQNSFRSLERPMSLPEGVLPMASESAMVQKKETRETLQQGQQHFAIYCVACHGALADGVALVPARGMKPPENLLIERFKAMPRAEIVAIIRNGKERMPSMRRKISETQAWSIASYLKALQLSRRISVKRLNPADREKLK